MKAIAQLKVIELASVLAGPLASGFFAEAGAEVIKIEKKQGGDITRSWKLSGESENAAVSSYFAAANWGKKHIFLDLNNPKDHAELEALLDGADILISNFKRGDDKKFNLDPLRLSEKYPSLIQGRIEGFRHEPERTAFDMVLQAECGYLSMTGTESGTAARLPVAFIDQMAAHQLKEGLLLALIHREQSGKGSLVDVSLYDSALSGLINQASAYLMQAQIPARNGTLHPSIAPYGEILRCADGKELLLAVGNDRQFNLLCQTLGIPGLADDPRFLNNPLRVRNRKELLKALSEAAAHINSTILFNALMKQRVPAGRIRNLAEVFEEPQVKSLVLEEEQDGILTKRIKGNVFSSRPYPLEAAIAGDLRP